MTQEMERCGLALDRAVAGEVVALVSSGDPGVYGMAGLALEMSRARGMKIPIEIVPGITSANAAAARFGAPLMLDYAVISLSDILVPWQTIMKRIEAVAGADLVIAFYNPRSRKRTGHIEKAARLVSRYRPGSTPVGIATGIGRQGERIVLTDLDHFLDEEMTMRSVVIIGNRSSELSEGWFITPRGYRL
jgi:precorrin-3B C17-methyltransferase